MSSYAVSGQSKTLKQYADVHDTIEAIQRIVKQNYPAVRDWAYQLKGDDAAQTYKNIWNFVRSKVRYQNDENGKEQLRTPQRTLHDGMGDCDDMSILISSLLHNLKLPHELIVAAYKDKNQWQHIYPVAYSPNGSRYVIDCVPEIPHFNYEAQPIKNQMIIPMRLEELGQALAAEAPTEMLRELTEPFELNALSGTDPDDEDPYEALQGILGNVAIVDETDDYDSVLSGGELQRNILLKQLVEAKQTLQKTGQSPEDLKLMNELIEQFEDEDQLQEAIKQAIEQGTIYQNFYKTIQYGLDHSVKGLSGEEDTYYLKVMDETGLYENGDYVEGLGFLKKLRNNIKKGIKKFVDKNPVISKITRAIKKYSPTTFALRRSMEPFLRANVFNMAEKLALGYASEDEARRLGYSKAEWTEFVKAKDKAEDRWFALGGEKAYFKKMVMNGLGAKKAGLKGELGVAPVIIAAVTKVFGAIIDIFKNLKLKKKEGSPSDAHPESNDEAVPTVKALSKSANAALDNKAGAGQAKVETDEKSGVTTETIVDENGKEKKVYKDKDGNEIGRFKAFFLKNKTWLIIVSIVLTLGIVGLVIWKIRQRSLNGLAGAGLSRKQENFIKRQGLNNRAYASLIREEIRKDKKPLNENNRRQYYKRVFQESFNRPLSSKQVSAAKNYNRMYHEVIRLAKAKGGGPNAWREAWKEVKKKA